MVWKKHWDNVGRPWKTNLKRERGPERVRLKSGLGLHHVTFMQYLH